MAQKYDDGEYISLTSLDGDECPSLIKGHVTIEQAQAGFDREFGVGEYTVTSVRHAYGFWGFANTEFGDHTSALFVRDSPGRGRFKVTECEWSFDPYVEVTNA